MDYVPACVITTPSRLFSPAGLPGTRPILPPVGASVVLQTAIRSVSSLEKSNASICRCSSFNSGSSWAITSCICGSEEPHCKVMCVYAKDDASWRKWGERMFSRRGRKGAVAPTVAKSSL